MPVTGISVIVQILESGTMTPIATQRGASLKLGADTIDASSKDNNAWADHFAGQKNWSIDADGLMELTDAAQTHLLNEFVAGNPVTVEILLPSGDVWRGDAAIVDHSFDFSKDDMATFSLSLQGKGEPLYKFETPAP